MRAKAVLAAGLGLAVFSLLLLMPTPSRADRASVGGQIGYQQPVSQDDAGGGVLVVGRFRYPVRPRISIEGALNYYAVGYEAYPIRGQFQEVRSWVITALTATVIYGKDLGGHGTHPYAGLGVGYYLLRKDEVPDSNQLGFTGLAGVEFLLREDVSLDLGVGADRISTARGGTRLIGTVRIGLTHYLGTY